MLWTENKLWFCSRSQCTIYNVDECWMLNGLFKFSNADDGKSSLWTMYFITSLNRWCKYATVRISSSEQTKLTAHGLYIHIHHLYSLIKWNFCSENSNFMKNAFGIWNFGWLFIFHNFFLVSFFPSFIWFVVLNFSFRSAVWTKWELRTICAMVLHTKCVFKVHCTMSPICVCWIVFHSSAKVFSIQCIFYFPHLPLATTWWMKLSELLSYNMKTLSHSNSHSHSHSRSDPIQSNSIRSNAMHICS